jgi:hypothetical protein
VAWLSSPRHTVHRLRIPDLRTWSDFPLRTTPHPARQRTSPSQRLSPPRIRRSDLSATSPSQSRPFAPPSRGPWQGHYADVLVANREWFYDIVRLGRHFDGFVEYIKRVSATCLIYPEHNLYSVPSSFANPPVSLRVYSDRFIVEPMAPAVTRPVWATGTQHAACDRMHPMIPKRVAFQRRPPSRRSRHQRHRPFPRLATCLAETGYPPARSRLMGAFYDEFRGFRRTLRCLTIDTAYSNTTAAINLTRNRQLQRLKIFLSPSLPIAAASD